MPIMDGFQAVVEIRKNLKDLPIIAQTAHAMAEDKQKVLDAGCNAYLAKPLDKKEVFKAIKQFLHI